MSKFIENISDKGFDEIFKILFKDENVHYISPSDIALQMKDRMFEQFKVSICSYPTQSGYVADLLKKTKTGFICEVSIEDAPTEASAIFTVIDNYLSLYKPIL